MKNNELSYSANSLMRDLRFVYSLNIVFLDWPPVRNCFKAVVQSGLELRDKFGSTFRMSVFLTLYLVCNPRA